MKKMCKTTITVPPLRILCSLHRVQSPLIIHTRCVKERQAELTVLKKARSDNRKESELNIWMFLLPFLFPLSSKTVFFLSSENLLLLSNIKWFMCVTRFQDFIVELCRTFVFQYLSFIFTKARRNWMVVLPFDNAGATSQSMEREKWNV